jgi:hypothetical protein
MQYYDRKEGDPLQSNTSTQQKNSQSLHHPLTQHNHPIQSNENNQSIVNQDKREGENPFLETALDLDVVKEKLEEFLTYNETTALIQSTKFFKKVFYYYHVKALFSLYTARKKSKPKPLYGIYYADEDDCHSIQYPINLQSSVFPKDIGYLVVIPVPYQDEYGRGLDRHPITLIKKYLKAIDNISHSSDTNNLRQKKIRILIGLNAKDDHFNLNQNTDSLRRGVCDFASRINSHLRKGNYPAALIPMIWGIDRPVDQGGKEFYFNGTEIDWVNSAANKLRKLLKNLTQDEKKRLQKIKMKFPFASVRSFLFESKICQKMLEELRSFNQQIYYLIGDADLISLQPMNQNNSVISMIHENIKGHNNDNKRYIRVGGATGFDNDEIAQHISSHCPSLSDSYLNKSVLMTQLFHSVDMATRKIMADISSELAYFSEPHTYMVSEIFDQRGDSFKYQGKKNNTKCYNQPITKKMRNSNFSEPDMTARVTRSIRQNKNWKGKWKTINKQQKFFADRSMQLLTSSRHDLVVIKPNNKPFSKAKKVQELNEKESLCMEKLRAIRAILYNQHNTQLKASQLNSRFHEAGYGKNTFKRVVEKLPDSFCFVKYFLREKDNIKNFNKKIKDKDSTKTIEKVKTIISDNTRQLFKKVTFLNIYQRLIEISAGKITPDNIDFHKCQWLLGSLSIEAGLLNEKAGIDNNNKETFETKKSIGQKENILKACCQLERLLRWLIVMISMIKNLDDKYEIKKIEHNTIANIQRLKFFPPKTDLQREFNDLVNNVDEWFSPKL